MGRGWAVVISPGWAGSVPAAAWSDGVWSVAVGLGGWDPLRLRLVVVWRGKERLGGARRLRQDTERRGVVCHGLSRRGGCGVAVVWRDEARSVLDCLGMAAAVGMRPVVEGSMWQGTFRLDLLRRTRWVESCLVGRGLARRMRQGERRHVEMRHSTA